ncbi:Hypothetical predicted protein [Paramuricea clavata]|uniref:Uncharacterized protein n=1 Tax=Paramuricea clavata TaxID=317549 RepID=A0A6S7HIR5_PARCT|nr:Hypothetical predicted protein [Paramuricea clavata]
MAESLSEVRKAVQDVACHALQASISHAGGGRFSFIVSTDNVQVANSVCQTAVTLGAIYAGYHLLKPLVDAAVTKVLGGENRDDQHIGEIKPGSLHVLLCCFTDERFLEVLADYGSGGIKERLQQEFSQIGIKTEELKVEVENIEEVMETKETIKKRYESNHRTCV